MVIHIFRLIFNHWRISQEKRCISVNLRRLNFYIVSHKLVLHRIWKLKASLDTPLTLCLKISNVFKAAIIFKCCISLFSLFCWQFSSHFSWILNFIHHSPFWVSFRNINHNRIGFLRHIFEPWISWIDFFLSLFVDIHIRCHLLISATSKIFASLTKFDIASCFEYFNERSFLSLS